jgi:hypothetical protein
VEEFTQYQQRMITVSNFRKMALGFEATDEKPHFDRAAFRVKGKIFVTLLEKAKTINCKLSPENQYVFSKSEPAIYPVADWEINTGVRP